MTHLQLASSTLQPKEKPSNWELALRIVRDVLRHKDRRYELWTNGNWVYATMDDIMKRANERLKSVGRPQFKGKESWLV